MDPILLKYLIPKSRAWPSNGSVQGFERRADGEERLDGPEQQHDHHHDGENGDRVAGHVPEITIETFPLTLTQTTYLCISSM